MKKMELPFQLKNINERIIDKMKQIYFPELTKITPTIHSTLIKITEESGELAKAILKFLPHESMKISQIKKDENILDNF